MGAVAVVTAAITVAAAILTWLAGLAGLRLFPDFRSREQKSGEYRRDVVAAPVASSTRQPCLLGPAMLLAITVTLVPACLWQPATAPRLGYLLALVWAETGLGWLDDWRKARGQGLGEHIRLAAQFLVVLGAAVAYVRLGFAGPVGLLSQIGQALAVAASFLYVVLAAGFSDGVDGLTTSLTTMTTLAFALLGVVLSSLTLGLGAGAALGAAGAALFLNAPSNWTRTGTVPRRSRAYIGDSGALLCGTLVAALAITSGTIALLPLLAAGIVLEGASVFLQTGLLTPLFRRLLVMRRFRAQPTFIPHTEFPLPFLATPLHYHLNLLGLRPLQVGAFFWLVQGVAAVAGIAAVLLTDPWWRVALWLIGLLLVLLPAAALVVTKPLFLGDEGSGSPALLICRGLPFTLGSFSCYRVVERLPGIRLPAAQASLLDRPMHRYDALALAALAAAGSGQDETAARLLRRLPPLNLMLRPEAALLALRQAQTAGTLATVVDALRAALRPLYQEGRLELVLEQLADLAGTHGQEMLAAAIREQLRVAGGSRQDERAMAPVR